MVTILLILSAVPFAVAGLLVLIVSVSPVSGNGLDVDAPPDQGRRDDLLMTYVGVPIGALLFVKACFDVIAVFMINRGY